ncbi:MAG: sugar phosphate nucleotidyltransferase [Patescibacteria group bacterium]
MKVVIFAGGVGTRLWPLSRKNSPKQFGKIIGDKSTLQQAVDRLQPEFKPEDIYVATGKRYSDIVVSQLPKIPKNNFIFEPEMRDVGPAIGLVTAILNKKYPNEPMAIIWSDHMVRDIPVFQKALRTAEKSIAEGKSDFVFIGQKPRFANQNVGWIQCGDEIAEEKGLKILEFKKLKYRPKLSQAEDFFENEHYVWNLGYFVTTPSFLIEKFEKYTPQMYEDLNKIIGSGDFDKSLSEIYPRLEKISFDDAILEKFSQSKISVISVDIGWSDIGAWEALKEALSENADENVTKGKVMVEDSRDSLVFNYTNQLTVGIDLEEMLVINTEDVVLVCPKSSVPKIKKLVESLAGTPHEHLT